MNIYEQMASDGLLELQMDGAAQALDSVCQMAAAEDWSYSHFLGKLLEAETSLRMKKKIAMAYQLARFPYKRTLTDFDFEAQPGVDKKLIEEQATLRYLSEGRNPIFLGPPGVGNYRKLLLMERN
jgi:DNA replication protein DnaC